MLGQRSCRRLASAVLAALMIGSVVSVGRIGTAESNTGFAVTTEPATDVRTTGATLQGNLTEFGDGESATVYLKYWKAGQKDETLTWWTGDVQSSPGSFAADLGLAPGTTYEYRMLAGNSDGEWTAGAVREVTTPDAGSA